MGSFNVKSGGAWRPATGVHVHASGAWRDAKEVWVKAGGVWRQAWSARTVSIIITGYESVQMGWDWNARHYDRITFGIAVTPYLAPSSVSWGGDVVGNGSSAVFTGPSYQPTGFTRQETGHVMATVVVGGQTHDLVLDFTYTAGDEL